MTRIGIVGASGMVGRAVAQHLRLAGMRGLRLGARRSEGLQREARAGEDIVAFDLADSAQLQRFCEGCAIVVNAAGPSRQVLDRVARASLAAGADYVDAAGDELVHELLAGTPCGDRRLLLSAGMMPGLTALLPRFLAAGLDGPLRLTAFAGGLDRFTRTAAGDYVDSLRNGYGTPLAAWRGRIATRALEARPDADIEFFPGRVTALPYLSQENTRIARTLGLAAGDWYNVFAGQHLRDAFARVQNLLHASGEAAAIEALCTSAALDLAGRAPYQLLVCRVESASASRSLMLRASDSYALTGAMAAFAALALCEGEVPPGVHFAGEVMAPDRTVTRLRSSSAVTAIDLVDGGAVDEPAFEQGAL
ncbi:NAD-dependent epimerase/dehydratase family protein [Verminephrobacter eiseniae]|uniref:NAD-dependent epimerase/dehydratase family protein n=1 Tax=Verminephrobacter eiseniae TaxID=364317 RepID=UPI0022390344|nr:NAD-dependent epimerase/dehydratase family protein [Verminephrobacter eiseniae]MCW5260615.1 NAD-dependent epimerase/dehydratase family protein [Verminephrobacter eiseniae]